MLSVTTTPTSAAGPRDASRNPTSTETSGTTDEIISPLKSSRETNEALNNTCGDIANNLGNEAGDVGVKGKTSKAIEAQTNEKEPNNGLQNNIKKAEIDVQHKDKGKDLLQKDVSSVAPLSMAPEESSTPIVPEVFFAEIQSAAMKKSSNFSLLKLEYDEEEEKSRLMKKKMRKLLKKMMTT